MHLTPSYMFLNQQISIHLISDFDPVGGFTFNWQDLWMGLRAHPRREHHREGQFKELEKGWIPFPAEISTSQRECELTIWSAEPKPFGILNEDQWVLGDAVDFSYFDYFSKENCPVTCLLYILHWFSPWKPKSFLGAHCQVSLLTPSCWSCQWFPAFLPSLQSVQLWLSSIV